MYLKRLRVSSIDGILRDVSFHSGLNLIIDNTAGSNKQKTGNNVGKTTVLKLIDYCLGAQAKILYQDPENPNKNYDLVTNYLRDKNVLVHLELIDEISNPSSSGVIIERNFLQYKKAIRTINGKQVKRAADYLSTLGTTLFPDLPEDGKPSLRQVISHNIRYSSQSVSHTIKTLDPHTREIEYETLYLYLLGCPKFDGASKQQLTTALKQEREFLHRLGEGHSVQSYEMSLSILNGDIERKDAHRHRLTADPEFEKKLQQANIVKAQISTVSARLSQIDLRISLIQDAQEELSRTLSSINTEELSDLYQEAQAFIPDMHRTFAELVEYHNAMVLQRQHFIASELPELSAQHDSLQHKLQSLLTEDKTLADDLSAKMSSKDYEQLVIEINDLYRKTGETESKISQLKESEKKINTLQRELSEISDNIRSPEYKEKLGAQMKKFNTYYSQVSRDLYGESYFLDVDTRKDKSGVKYYDFTTANALNMSDGKKQGEILCFDLAYTMFADAEGMDCLHFLLNDKKELLHGNQLEAAAQLAENNGIQLVVSMLKDKLPTNMDISRSIVLELSQESKFFRIEEFS